MHVFHIPFPIEFKEQVLVPVRTPYLYQETPGPMRSTMMNIIHSGDILMREHVVRIP